MLNWLNMTEMMRSKALLRSDCLGLSRRRLCLTLSQLASPKNKIQILIYFYEITNVGNYELR